MEEKKYTCIEMGFAWSFGFMVCMLIGVILGKF